MTNLGIFLYELSQICEKATLPIILGGDFNLIREISDKNLDNHNQTLMDKFNDFIDDYQLRELKRSGQKYTWTNKQENPVPVNLDRVFFSMGWEEKFPLSISWCLSIVGSDHAPIIVDNGESLPLRQRYFFFDQQWLMRKEIKKLISDTWKDDESRCPELGYSLDCWHGCSVLLRTKLKGWNIRRMGDQKKEKAILRGELQQIDEEAK